MELRMSLEAMCDHHAAYERDLHELTSIKSIGSCAKTLSKSSATLTTSHRPFCK
jgi:hypothetical protein